MAASSKIDILRKFREANLAERQEVGCKARPKEKRPKKAKKAVKRKK